ncbi:hypothetical protein EZ449_19940 [Pedobacter frigidisoli]|uniref:Outer membrane protein beta-barrel domain-containing protein n=1 Tax=Pedobacter frigidisoli TaxID=2530455 RepID=A0A4R0NJB9_9SPHI|nr:hypothetical protein [Pedobacter frigidisoli]TCD00771.1 hypothetical protein EZ449_19940 [Pedobacter frigidisoli]
MKSYLLTASLVFIGYTTFAQQDKLHKNRKTYFGMGFSLGKGSIDGTYGDIFIYAEQKSYYLALKTSAIEEIRLFGSQPDLTVSDVSLIAGKRISLNQYHTFQFGFGISVFGQQTKGAILPRVGKECLFCSSDYEIIKKSQFAIPVEIRYHLNLDHTASLNLGFSASLNKLNSFYAVSIGTTLGRLRDRIKKR